MRRSGKRWSQRGAAMVEFALIFPFLSMLILGVIDAGRVYVTWVHVDNAAHEAATFASIHPGYQANTSTCADPNNVAWHADYEGSSSSAAYTVAISPVTSSSCVDNPPEAPAGSNVTVTVTDTTFTLLTPMVSKIMGSIHPSATVTVRVAG